MQADTLIQTIVQLLEAEDDQLTANIRNSTMLLSSIRRLASSPPPSRGGAGGGRANEGAGSSDDEFEDDGLDADGEGEIANLARRILDLTEEGAGESRFTNKSAASNGVGGGDEQVGSQGSDHAALRASVRQALGGQN